MSISNNVLEKYYLNSVPFEYLIYTKMLNAVLTGDVIENLRRETITSNLAIENDKLNVTVSFAKTGPTFAHGQQRAPLERYREVESFFRNGVPVTLVAAIEFFPDFIISNITIPMEQPSIYMVNMSLEKVTTQKVIEVFGENAGSDRASVKEVTVEGEKGSILLKRSQLITARLDLADYLRIRMR
jgi:hypothetical protein